MGTFLALHAAFTCTFILLLIDIVNDKSQEFGPVRTATMFVGALLWEVCLLGVIVRWFYHKCTDTAESKPITEVMPLPKPHAHTSSGYELVEHYHKQRTEPALKVVEQHSSDRLQHV